MPSSRSALPTSRQAPALLGWLLPPMATAIVGAIASLEAGTFYQQLSKPAWAPPAGLFSPVWTVLYLLMGISAWLVWRADGFSRSRGALALFIAQLAANALWSWLFFRWHQGALAFGEMLLLWALIAATLIEFRRFSQLAATLMLPYLLWVTFASALALSTWQRNPGLL